MAEFITFFIIIAASLLFSEFFNRLHLPWVTALIASGIVLGPEALGFIESNDITDFFSETGLIFLMFMAGLEVSFNSFRRVKKEISIISSVSALASIVTALAIAAWFNLTPNAGLLLAVALVSSSIAVVFPSLEGRNVLRRNVGQSIIGSTVVLDVVSVTFFSILIQQSSGTDLPLPVLYVFLALALILLRIAVPKLEDYFNREGRQKFEQELQLIISVLVGAVVLFGLIGLNPAEAGFFAGLVLSDSIQSQVTRAKLHTIAYGLFIPVFFVMVGADMRLSELLRSNEILLLSMVVLIGSIITKFTSGWLGGRLALFSNNESLLIGASTTPQLNVTLAIAATGFAAGLIDQNLLTVFIILTVGTTLFAPLVINRMAERVEKVDST